MNNGEGLSFEQIIAFVEHAPANIFFKDAFCRYRAVSETCALINGDETCNIIGKTDMDVWADKEVGRRYYEDDLRIVATGQSSKWVDEFPGPDGSLYFEISKRPAYLDGELIGIVGIVMNITEQKRLEAELERLTTTDGLTGLRNRNYLELAHKEPYPEESYPITLVLMDCNNLKKVNDSHGHEAGDELLVRVSGVIGATVPPKATAARLGGDEFLAACPHMDEDGAQQLMAELRAHFQESSDESYALDVAIGHAVVKDATQSCALAYREADQEMYEDKRKAHEGR